MNIRIQPYTRDELIAVADRNNNVIVVNLSIPLSVLIDMGEQLTNDTDPTYIEGYIHEKLIPPSNTDECLHEMASVEYMVVGHVPGINEDVESQLRRDEFDASEGEVIIQVTANVKDIVEELKEEQRQDEKHGLHPEHENVAN